MSMTRGDFLSGSLVGGILKRLDRLERQQRQSAEQLTPNYLTIDPKTGVVSAHFSGVVTAQGVTLQAGTGQGQAPSEIDWQRADGALIAYVQAYEDANNHADVLLADAQGQGTNAGKLTTQAAASDGTGASVQLTATNGGPGKVVAEAVDASTPQPTPHDLTLIDSTGASDLLRLAATGTLAIDWGLVTLTWTAGTNSGLSVVNHRLGRQPQAVVATAINAPAFGNIPLANVSGTSNTQFDINAEVKSNFASYPHSVGMFWIAVG